jgi:hypothetical protein
MNKDVKKYLRENRIRIPLSTKMAKYYLSIGEKCLIKIRGDYYIVKLSNIVPAMPSVSCCKRYDIRYIIKNMYYLHNRVYIGPWSLTTLYVPLDTIIYDI